MLSAHQETTNPRISWQVIYLCESGCKIIIELNHPTCWSPVEINCPRCGKKALWQTQKRVLEY